MAPPTADAARSANNTQGRRPVPRVIPAIPLGLSKPPRDTGTRLANPKDSTTDTLAHRASHQPKPQLEDKEPKDPPTTAVHAPLTPDLKISDTLDGNGHVSLRDSPHKQMQSDPREDVRNAQDPEAAEQHKAVHNRPSPPHTRPKTAAVNGARQPTAIPTQLPPPFYPADQSASRSSATDCVALPAHTSGASTHRVRPSVEGIVFGAAQESPAMPSTPRETELDTNVQHQLALRPPPGFAPPQFTPAFHPGHSHHPSDAAMTWSQPGISMAPTPDAIYGNGHDHNQSTFNTGLSVYLPPDQGRLSPALGPPTANGSATSHSQSPSKSQFADVKTGSDYEDEMPAMHYPNGSGPPALRPEDSHIALAHWLSSQYGKPNLADFVLHIRSPEAILLSLPVHGIVVSRSPVIADAMQRSVPVTHPAGAPSRLVDIPTPNKFVTSEFLNEAVKFLYGAPLLSPPLFLGGLGPYDQEGEQSHTFHEARTRMAHALSYTAAGRVLQLPMLQACGTRISSALLRWDNVDQALHYGLDEFRQASSRDANGLDSLETGTGAILSCAIDFLACEFPVDFSLHSTAPELRDDPRLPTFSESRAPSHNPRLSRIRFGEAPPEEDIKATYTTRILSSILLSLPLILLERLLSHPATADRIGWAGVVKVMRDVVVEREKRRQRALKFHQASNGNVPRALVENLYYEEHVEHVTGSPIHPFQHRLTAIRLAGQP